MNNHFPAIRRQEDDADDDPNSAASDSSASTVKNVTFSTKQLDHGATFNRFDSNLLDRARNSVGERKMAEPTLAEMAPLNSEEEDEENADFESRYAEEDDDDFDDDDEAALESRSGRSSCVDGSFLQDDDYEEEYDSEDERQTEALENYVLEYANAPPPPPPVLKSSLEGLAGGRRLEVPDLVPDERTIRKAVLLMVKSNRCWGTAAAKKMRYISVTPSPALHYFVESFAESRTVFWSSDPFEGQSVNGPENGDPPDPWSIPARPPAAFTPHASNVEVPHTASLRNCVQCRGRGAAKCVKCKAKRNVKCTKCHGSGRTTRQGRRSKCAFCHGRGKKKCATCGGDGRQKCKGCGGSCRLKYCVMLGISFHVHKSDHAFETSSIPPEVLRGETGVVVFEETRTTVTHIRRRSAPQVEAKSKELLDEHAALMEYERPLLQRHALTAVPVTEVRYRYKGKEGIFWIFGQDLRCYFPHYPDQSRWGCSLS